MKQLNRETGKKGEVIAEEFLRKKNYKILDRNNSTKFGEIDLIASKNGILIFIEVKLKQTEDFGTPEEMIGLKKLGQVKRMAELYLLGNTEISSKYDAYQIDAVCIVTNYEGKVERINHYENISF